MWGIIIANDALISIFLALSSLNVHSCRNTTPTRLCPQTAAPTSLAAAAVEPYPSMLQQKAVFTEVIKSQGEGGGASGALEKFSNSPCFRMTWARSLFARLHMGTLQEGQLRIKLESRCIRIIRQGFSHFHVVLWLRFVGYQ